MISLTQDSFIERYRTPDNKEEYDYVFERSKRLEIVFDKQKGLLDLISSLPIRKKISELGNEDAQLYSANNSLKMEYLLEIGHNAKMHFIENDTHGAYVHLVFGEDKTQVVLPIKQYNSLFQRIDDDNVSIMLDTGVKDISIKVKIQSIKNILFLKGKTVGRNLRRGDVYLNELMSELSAKTKLNGTRQLSDII